MCSYYYNPKLEPPHPPFSFHDHHHPQVFASLLGAEGVVLLKEVQWLSGARGYGEWRAIKGSTVWWAVMLRTGILVVLWGRSVCDPLRPFLVAVDSRYMQIFKLHGVKRDCCVEHSETGWKVKQNPSNSFFKTHLLMFAFHLWQKKPLLFHQNQFFSSFPNFCFS